MSQACDLNAVTARRLIGARKLSPVELVDACIACIEAMNPVVNAICATDFDRAREQARAAEAAVVAGQRLGVLHGLPLGVKDLLDTQGLRTTYGSPLYEHHVPDRDHPLVATLRRAGAIVLCKTNVPEWGAGANTTNPVWGATGNPFDPQRICGGSSGGSAVALATRMLPLATGSDSGGSLRIPAAFCGVVAHRSTPGVVPNPSRAFGYTNFGVLGPMARNVDDAVLMYRAMVAFDTRDPLTAPVDPAHHTAVEDVDLSRLRVAVSADLGFAPVDRRIRATFGERLEIIAPAFGDCVERDPPLAEVARTNWILRGQVFLANFREHYLAQRQALGPHVRFNVEAALDMTAADIAWATAQQTKIHRDMAAFFDDVDILIAPTVPVPPFPLEQPYCDRIDGQQLDNYVVWLSLTFGLTIPGNPVAAIPCGLEPTGTPFGLQICGRHHDDRFVLGVARALERLFAQDPRTAPPVPDLGRLTG